ncbi:DegV family protein [Butyricicoccus sp.]|uniref:DegV family protein n=1 Tax=Butyricicoccus sp. TaxID=2049021 RepID=UPI003AADE5DD
MSKIAILADSSCDFTPERAQKAGFSVVPLQVTFEDGSVYRDGIDLTSEEFFKKLAASKQLPKTSQPTIETWMDAMKQFADYDDIIVITVSGKVSGSLSGASMARRMLREEEEFRPNIHLIDSMTASGAVAGFALEAVRMVREGCRAQEILNRLLYLQNHLAVYFIFDSLEYLRKGGRIGKATALAGKVMGIKPLLTFFEGEPKNVDKVRGVQAGCKKLVEGFLQRTADLHHVMVISSCAPERVEMITRMLQTHISDIAITYVEIGAVIGTYVGPGGIALVYEEKEARW